MGTRAVFTFKDENQSFSVYKHWDGYPENAAEYLTQALRFTWILPRFEPGEFAAAFISANKTQPGDIRLTAGADAHGDLSYDYEIFQAKNGQMIIKSSDGFYGRLEDFIDKYGNNNDRRHWNEMVPSANPLEIK